MKWLLGIFVVIGILCLGGWMLKRDATPMLPDPPVGITFRQSAWFPGYVAQITNNHSTGIQVILLVENDTTQQKKSWSFPVPQGETKEIGMLEVEWHFDPGEHGCIQVQGYTKKLYYELMSGGKFRTWFAL